MQQYLSNGNISSINSINNIICNFSYKLFPIHRKSCLKHYPGFDLRKFLFEIFKWWHKVYVNQTHEICFLNERKSFFFFSSWFLLKKLFTFYFYYETYIQFYSIQRWLLNKVLWMFVYVLVVAIFVFHFFEKKKMISMHLGDGLTKWIYFIFWQNNKNYCFYEANYIIWMETMGDNVVFFLLFVVKFHRKKERRMLQTIEMNVWKIMITTR